MPNVLIFRRELLPFSETFIAAQAAELGRYHPVFAGLRRARNSLPCLPGPVILPGAAAAWRFLSRQTAFAPGLMRRARAYHPALVHAHFALDGAEALPVAGVLNVPLLVTLHGYDVMCSDLAHKANRRGRLYLQRREQLWREAAAFVCVSEAIRRRAVAVGFPPEKLRTFPIGIQVSTAEPLGALVAEPRILFVGRLVAKKGCAVLIRALGFLQRLLPQARLLIAGDGPERQALEELAARHTRGTRFLGTQTPAEVRAWMRTSRCLAAPSLTAADGDAEGLPTVLCEALAAGLPVASTVHSGIPELIVHGEHGLLASEGDAETLAHNLHLLCTDDQLANRMRAAGKAQVERSFNIEKQTRLLEELYDEIGGAPAFSPVVPLACLAGTTSGPAAGVTR